MKIGSGDLHSFFDDTDNKYDRRTEQEIYRKLDKEIPADHTDYHIHQHVFRHIVCRRQSVDDLHKEHKAAEQENSMLTIGAVIPEMMTAAVRFFFSIKV